MNDTIAFVSSAQSADLSLSCLLDLVKERTANMGFTEPDDDWAPMLFLLTMDGNIVIENIPNPFFASKQTKELLAEVFIPARILQNKAMAYALLLNAWTLPMKLKPGQTLQDARAEMPKDFSDAPDRIEVLMLEAGDAEAEQMFQAFIERHPGKPPTLSPWADVASQERGEAKYTSRFFAPIREALLQVKFPDRVKQARDRWED